MSQFTFMFLLIIVWPLPIVLATVFYLQKRKLQQTLDAIKQIINSSEEEQQGDERSEEQSHFLRERKEDGTIVYQNMQK